MANETEIAPNPEVKKPSPDRIVEPGEVDILCGRGGLSNHHPGNEWYRRLIRSNRPLYRACPKHTKLLVSKAIVQAVQQQGGRFLERSRKNGFWYEVSYKRAVDKTSQGLRERDRDDEGHALATVPQQFSGKTSHKLSDLADVAIAHAAKTDGLPRSASGLVSRTQSKTLPTSKPKEVVPPKQLLPTAARNGPVPHPPPPTARTQSTDLNPLPPTMEARQSSMFRLLKNAKLLPAESAYILGPNSQQTMHPSAMAAAAQQRYPVDRHPRLAIAAPQPPPPRPTATHAPTMYPGYPPMPSGYPYAMSTAAAASAKVPATATAPATATIPAAAGAPALTRLTSQVSDWLNSFWPIPPPGRSGAPASAVAAPVDPARAAAVAAASVAAIPRSRPRVAPPIINVPPPAPMESTVHITTVPPPPVKSNGDGAAVKSMAKTAPHPQGMPPSPPVATNSYHHQSGATMAAAMASSSLQQRPTEATEIPNPPSRTDGDAPAEEPSLDVGAPPTELEHSVSATLLKLASAPTTFFSGISALFGDELPPPKTPVSESTTSGPDALPPLAGTKRSQGSLLDDDDDDDDLDHGGATTVPPILPPGMKKRRTSLLDDYEESPMEARMRSIS